MSPTTEAGVNGTMRASMAPAKVGGQEKGQEGGRASIDGKKEGGKDGEQGVANGLERKRVNSIVAARDSMSAGSEGERVGVGLEVQKVQMWVERLTLPADVLLALLGHMRELLMCAAEREGALGVEEARVWVAGQVGELTEELEDRLRGHWPRKGRVEVGVRDVRDGEIRSHGKILERWGKGWGEKGAGLEQGWVGRLQKLVVWIGECEGRIGEVGKVGGKGLGSVAGYQGCEVRLRQELKVLEREGMETCGLLESWVVGEVERLVQMAHTFVRGLRLQETGGDWADSEVEEVKVLVQGRVEDLEGKLRAWQGELGEQKARMGKIRCVCDCVMVIGRFSML